MNPKEKNDVVFLQEYLENYPAKMGASANIKKKLFNIFQTCTGKRVYSFILQRLCFSRMEGLIERRESTKF